MCVGESRAAVHAAPWPFPQQCAHLQANVGFPAVSSFKRRPFVMGSFPKWFDVQGFHPGELANQYSG